MVVSRTRALKIYRGCTFTWLDLTHAILFYIDILLWLYFRIPTTEWSHESKISLFPISYIFLAIYPTKKKNQSYKNRNFEQSNKNKTLSLIPSTSLYLWLTDQCQFSESCKFYSHVSGIYCFIFYNEIECSITPSLF